VIGTTSLYAYGVFLLTMVRVSAGEKAIRV